MYSAISALQIRLAAMAASPAAALHFLEGVHGDGRVFTRRHPREQEIEPPILYLERAILSVYHEVANNRLKCRFRPFMAMLRRGYISKKSCHFSASAAAFAQIFGGGAQAE
jgi:hypothetical protein